MLQKQIEMEFQQKLQRNKSDIEEFENAIREKKEIEENFIHELVIDHE